MLLPWHENNQFLEPAIESIMNSNSVQIQLILIDDRPNPAKDFFGRMSSIQTNGIGYERSLNAGRNLIEGDYTTIMNSDDLVHPDKFAIQIRELEQTNKKLNITKMQKLSPNFGNYSQSLKPNICNEIYPETFLINSKLANATWLGKSNYWIQKIVFSDNGNGSDWLLGSSLSTDWEHWSYLTEELYFYRQHKNQITAKWKTVSPKIIEGWANLNNRLGMPALPPEIGASLVFLRSKKISTEICRENLRQLVQWSDELSQKRPALTDDLNRSLAIFYLKQWIAPGLLKPKTMNAILQILKEPKVFDRISLYLKRDN